MHVKELFSLSKKVILVSGGAGNYGKCIAEGLAEADATVIIASRNLENAEQTAQTFRASNLDVYALQVDQGDHASVIRLKEAIVEKFNRLDVFINNAVSRPMKGYDGDMSDFSESMRVNATGCMDILREMAGLIEAGGGGSIVNIGSIFGMYGPDLLNYEGTNMGTPPPDYFFHNGGLINLTRYMAKVFAGKNIRVNCISPGGLFNHQPEVFLHNYCKKVPLGRMANTDDIKGLVVLLSSQAGAYINGENIVMDGGLKA